MVALILNSGLGSRMGDITKNHPKCMTKIPGEETILSRQLRLLAEVGIKNVIITTGFYRETLIDYCNKLQLPLNISFMDNPMYDKTNSIYSIYCAREKLNDDIIIMHGDLVFEKKVLEGILNEKKSCMKISSTLPIPEKDFKAVIKDGRICAIGVEFWNDVVEAQAFYKLQCSEWKKWLDKIIEYCETGRRNCYAEVAFNDIAEQCEIYGYDAKQMLCTEIDNLEDLENVSRRLNELNSII